MYPGVCSGPDCPNKARVEELERELTYLRNLVYKMSRPGLQQQSDLYKPDNRHVQELPGREE